MGLEHRAVVTAWAIFAATGCASVGATPSDGGSAGGDGGGGSLVDAPCPSCGDTDGDGVADEMDECGNTPSGAPVNGVGCADSQLIPHRELDFPPYGLTWTENGDLGRAIGLTWAYTGIDRADLFHIYWLVCDDPVPCGLSLNGPIDAPSETWVISVADSDLPAGKLTFTNLTQVELAEGGPTAIHSRMTLNIVDDGGAAIPFAPVGNLGVLARTAAVGAEIDGTAFTVTGLGEVQDPSTLAWVPYLDWFDAAPTVEGGPSLTVALNSWFYDK